MRELLKGLGRRAGYRVERWRPANRFNEMADTLDMLRARAYRPRVIVDAGANVGDWARLALRMFPDAAVYLIEPQAACRPALERLAASRESMTLHAIALSEPGRTRLSFTGGIEAQLYDINHNGLPVFRDVFDLLCGRHFELYDFASLSARPRDQRLRMLDAVFVRTDSAVAADRSWL